MAELFARALRVTTPTTPPAPRAAFEAPWHGQVFALTVALNEAEHFSWNEWADLFGACLKDAGKNSTLVGSDDYYRVWVTALEKMMLRKETLTTSALDDMKTLWTDAFLSTPHGQPVVPKI